MPYKYIIIGGVAAGATAATKIRRLDEKAEITIFEKGPYISFANCGLPYYINSEIQNKSSLILVTPQVMKDRFSINCHVNHCVTKIDRTNQTITVKNLENQTNTEIENTETISTVQNNTENISTHSYDKLIICTGATSVWPSFIPHAKNTFKLQTIPDAVSIREFIQQTKPSKACIIGAGYIGLEMADVLNQLQIQVTVVELMDQILPPMDRDLARVVQSQLTSRGIEFLLGDGVKSFQTSSSNHITHVICNSGTSIETQLVIVAIGVSPNNQLARDSGLALESDGTISVNDHLFSITDENILACGDVIQYRNRVTQKKQRLGLAGPANRSGRAAAINAYSSCYGYQLVESPMVCGSFVTQMGKYRIAGTGLSEKAAIREGFSTGVSLVTKENHVSYYPGSKSYTLKLVYCKESGRILGAQAVGPTSSVAKTIDVISMAIQGNLTVWDGQSADLCYAPQVNSANDHFNQACFSAVDTLSQQVNVMTPLDYCSNRKNVNQLLDVRTQREWDQGHLENAFHCDLNQIRQRLDELRLKFKDEKVVVYCASGKRSYIACRILGQEGLNVVNLLGGYNNVRGFCKEYS